MTQAAEPTGFYLEVDIAETGDHVTIRAHCAICGTAIAARVRDVGRVLVDHTRRRHTRRPR